jgi:branched-chain amino acid aminotransferase
MATLEKPFAIQPTSSSRLSTVDFNKLGFGDIISDHMFVAEYVKGEWTSAKIVPYGDLLLNPAMLALHYGQSVFEGMKAFKNSKGEISIFRAQKHYQRFLKSLDRMCMVPVPEHLFIGGLEQLINVDKEWIPTVEGGSLYLRPFAFATESRLGVKIAEKYLFIILTSPVGPYYSKPVRVKVEDHFVRAAEGGAGYAKCAGNYGGAYYPTKLANEQGFDQVLWTDAKEHKYIDESGTMNVMFVIDGKLVTPKLTTAVLDGVTRDSILTLAKEMGVVVEERKFSVEELQQAFINNTISEAFGAGTAAVVAPIASINIQGTDYTLPEVSPDSFQLRVKKKLNDIRMGVVPDAHQWIHLI